MTMTKREKGRQFLAMKGKRALGAAPGNGSTPSESLLEAAFRMQEASPGYESEELHVKLKHISYP